MTNGSKVLIYLSFLLFLRLTLESNAKKRYQSHLGKKVLPEIGVANDPSSTLGSTVPAAIIYVCT